MRKSLILIVLMITFFIFLIFYFGIPIILNSIKPAKPFISTITLDNQCTVHDEAFMVVTRPYNRRGYFSNGIARIKVMSDWKVRLEANDKYPEFKYDGNEYLVKKNLKLIADCGTSKRLKGIFGAFNEQFK